MKQKLLRISLPILAGAGCMIAILSAAGGVAKWQAEGPGIGDILVFKASPDAVAHGAAPIVAAMLGGDECVLNTDTLRRSGGSFVVEAQVPETQGKFVVHWAGNRTADDAGTCGPSADLVLNHRQLDRLGSAAAGFQPIDEADQIMASFASK